MPRAKRSNIPGGDYYNLNKLFIAGPGHVYTIDAANALQLWMRMTPGAPTDSGPNALTSAYGTQTSHGGKKSFGQKIYHVMNWIRVGGNTKTSVTSTAGKLSFTSLSDGGTPTSTSDRPFSVSIWFQADVEQAPGSGQARQTTLLAKQSGAQNTHEWYLMCLDGGDLRFTLVDEKSNADGNSNYMVMVQAVDVVGTSMWNHVLVTYDGRGSAAGHTGYGCNMYFNGKKLEQHGDEPTSILGKLLIFEAYAPGSGGDYVGMKPDWTRPMDIGPRYGASTWEGVLGEVGVWSKELTEDEALAVYHGSKVASYYHSSGILNHPPRIVQRSLDHTTGSYPAISRTGDKDRRGSFLAPYDDRDTVSFSSPYATATIKFIDLPHDTANNPKTIKLQTPSEPIEQYDLNYDFATVDATYEAASNLVLWIRFSESSGVAEELGPNSLTVTTTNSPSTSIETLGKKVYPATAYVDGGSGANTSVTSSKLSFSTVAAEADPTADSDLPFTFSVWVNVTDVSTQTHSIFSKESDESAAEYEYLTQINQQGAVRLFLRDTTAPGTVLMTTADGLINDLTWYHLAFTYDGRGGGDGKAAGGVKIYIDGQEVSISIFSGWESVAADYVGMSPYPDEKLWIATDQNGSGCDFTGKLAEMAAWSTSISAEDVKTLYGATRGAFHRKFLGQTETFEFNRGNITEVENTEVKIPWREVKTVEAVATIFAETVQDSSLKMNAIAKGTSVTLEQNIPGAAGNSTIGNKTLVSGSESDPKFRGGSDALVSFPTSLPDGNRHISDIIVTPNIKSDITGYGKVRKGVSDNNVRFTPGEGFSPFEENRVPLEDSVVNDFYMSGTSEDLIPAFSNRLADKTQLVFNLISSPTREIDGWGNFTSPIWWATGSLGTTYSDVTGPGSGMAYFNPSRESWEQLEPSQVDVYSGTASIRQQTCLGFAPDSVAEYNFHDTDEEVKANVGMPIYEFGFPAASQYNATGSQTIRMSDYISRPFLLEKIHIEISGTFGLLGVPAGNNPNIKQFFILNQFTNGDAPRDDGTFIATHWISGSHYIQGAVHTPYESNFTIDGIRDLVSFANFGFHHEGWENPWGVGEEVWDSHHVFEFDPGAHAVTASMTAEVTPRIATSTDALAGFPVRSNLSLSAGVYKENPIDPSDMPRSFSLVSNPLGSRDLRGTPSGRSLIRAVPASRTVSTHAATVGNAGDYQDVMPNLGPPYNAISYPGNPRLVQVKETRYDTSPYILMPTDRLVFGWQNHPKVPTNKVSYHLEDAVEYEIAEKVVDRLVSCKVTLFGSLVRDGKEHHEGLNQSLTSDAIHEAVTEGSIVDQWDVEPSSVFGGSYVDEQYDGDVTMTLSGSDGGTDNMTLDYTSGEPGIRGVYGSFTKGTMGVTGSLTRGVVLSDKSEVYYDSLPPNFGDVVLKRDIQTDNFPLGDDTFKGITLDYGNQGEAFYAGSRKHAHGFPFEADISGIDRKLGVESIFKSTGGTDVSEDEIVIIKASDRDSYGYDTHDTDFPSTTGQDRVGPLVNRELFTGTGVNLNGLEEGVYWVEYWNDEFAEKDPKNLMKFFWGIGDSNNQGPYRHAGWVKYNGGGAPYGSVFRLELRGFKYGLINAVPMNSRAVFRYDRHGQLRDTLEQRKMTRYHLGSVTTTAVACKFFDYDGNSVTAEQTHCQNLDQRMTSSVPFFDMDGRLRDDNDKLMFIGRNRDTDPDDVDNLVADL